MSRYDFCLLNRHLVFFAILVATWDCRLIEQALSFKDGLNSILVDGLGLCESWLPLGYVMAHVKDFEWSPWRQGGRCFPPTHPCVLEPSFKSPRVLSSVTFGQRCHLSFALRRLARDWLSCAPAIPGSQALCSQGHRAGWMEADLRLICVPSNALPTTLAIRYWIPADCRWPPAKNVLVYTGFWEL